MLSNAPLTQTLQRAKDGVKRSPKFGQVKFGRNISLFKSHFLIMSPFLRDFKKFYPKIFTWSEKFFLKTNDNLTPKHQFPGFSLKKKNIPLPKDFRRKIYPWLRNFATNTPLAEESGLKKWPFGAAKVHITSDPGTQRLWQILTLVLRIAWQAQNKQRVLMHRHQGWNVRHGLCHIYMRYIYIWVVYSFCLFCCLFIIVTWWYIWCIVWQVASKRKYRHVW